MEELVNSLVKVFNIEGGKDYLIKYSTKEEIGLGYTEIKSMYDALRRKFPNNEIIFVPDIIEIKEYDIDDLKELKIVIESFIKEKEED